MAIFLQFSIARRKCLRVPRKVVLWSIHWDIRILVPMLYLKLWTYIYRPSRCQREATGGHRRFLEVTGGSISQFALTDFGLGHRTAQNLAV